MFVAAAVRRVLHWQANVSAVGFEARTGWFAACADSANDYDGLMAPNGFMGPVSPHGRPSRPSHW